MKITVRKRFIGTIPSFELVNELDKNNPLPIIVYYHGWQINKTLVFTQGRKLAQKGFRVILPDAMNHGERLQDISKIPSLTFFQSIHTNLFEFGYIINYFKERHLTNDFIGVGGLSMGGMTTCALLTHNPQINAAACVMGTPALTDYRDMIKHYATKANIYLPEDYEILTNWVTHYDLSRQTHLLGDRPLFIWHGDEDDKVPFSQTKDFVDNNPDLNLEVHFEHAGHLVQPQTMDKITDFFVKSYQDFLISN
ncbi:alpha/beta fold hydrolase [Aerococcaceae bacterium WGS1372]